LQLATQQLQLQNGVLHVSFFLQLARQRLLCFKLQEKLLIVAFSDEGIKLAYFDIFDMLFQFLAFV